MNVFTTSLSKNQLQLWALRLRWTAGSSSQRSSISDVKEVCINICLQVQEKAAAQAEYQAAMRNRQTAILLEETTPDIFQIKVGHLSPGAGAKVGPLIPTAGSTGLLQVSLVYLSELPVEDDKIRLTIPTTVAPRYISESYLSFLVIHLSRYVPSMDNSEEARKISSIQHSSTSPAQVKL